MTWQGFFFLNSLILTISTSTVKIFLLHFFLSMAANDRLHHPKCLILWQERSTNNHFSVFSFSSFCFLRILIPTTGFAAAVLKENKPISVRADWQWRLLIKGCLHKFSICADQNIHWVSPRVSFRCDILQTDAAFSQKLTQTLNSVSRLHYIDLNILSRWLWTFSTKLHLGPSF